MRTSASHFISDLRSLRAPGPLTWYDRPKTLRFRRRYHVQVVPLNNGLGVSRLKSGVAQVSKFSDVHRNERVAQNVIRQAEPHAHFGHLRVHCCNGDWVGVDGISFKPCPQVRLYGDLAEIARLRYG